LNPVLTSKARHTRMYSSITVKNSNF
jgi:hypothetical protein